MHIKVMGEEQIQYHVYNVSQIIVIFLMNVIVKTIILKKMENVINVNMTANLVNHNKIVKFVSLVI